MQDQQKVLELQAICCEARRRAFETVLNAQSGHIGGPSSSTELMACLYFGGILRFDPTNPQNPCRDRVLVRGHLGPLRYSIFSLLGWISKDELSTYRILGSRLQGHEVMEMCPGVDITPSGSLGMLLSFGTGAAVSLSNRELQSTVYVFLGDGEEQEGNVAEAARHAVSLGLTNLVCIMDQNTKQLSRPTTDVDRADIRKVWEGYGWDVKEIKNGHSIPEILQALRASRDPQKPTLILAHTTKGYRLKDAEEHPSGYHTASSCPRENIVEAITELEDELRALVEKVGPLDQVIGSRLRTVPNPPDIAEPKSTQLEVNIKPTTADHFDEVLASYIRNVVALFEKRPDMRLYSMTADWNSATVVRECHFDRHWVHYIDVGIREQHLLAMARGISAIDPDSRIMIIDGDGFALRASDQLHAIAQAGSKMIIIGTDSGICEARNGSTHQSTGQPGMLTSMPGLLMLEPADGVDLHNCLNWAFTEYPGPVYLRLHSSSVARFPTTTRNIQAYTVYEPKSSCRLVLVGSGLPLDGMNCLAKRLDLEEGLGIRVVNVIDMEHLDRSFVELLEDGVPLLAVYNGNPFVLESAVARAILEQEKPRPSAIRGHGFTLGTSGRLEQLLKHFRLDAEGIEGVMRQVFPELPQHNPTVLP